MNEQNTDDEEDFYEMGDPQEFVRKPIVRFTIDERTELIRRLESLSDDVAALYDPSLFGLIECLKHDGDSGMSGYTTNSNEKVEEYFLVCISPPHTWKLYIGRGGFFTVDPSTFKPRSYKLTAIN